jgi:HTH-type transcriptional repressor of NAD biosynthesis genes
MLRAAREVTHTPIDCAFTSEAYGAELAQRLGARHVAVDPARALVPISASALRADPSAGWEHLAPCVRQDLARRVVLVGAESTGKTTLAQRLAARLRQRSAAVSGTQWVLEYGREYTLYKPADARGRATAAGAA